MHFAPDVSQWADFIKKIRQFMDSEGLIEVFTNIAVPAGAFEGTIDTFKVPGLGELHTSPEIEMKRLLSRNQKSLYQITRCFRDDPDTGVHLKEFTMLEYYRVGATYEKLIEDMQRLISLLSGKNVSLGSVSVAKAIDGRINPTGTDTWEDAFFKYLIEVIEPSLPKHIPTVVRDYPAQVSALASGAHGLAERFEIYWKGMEICNGCNELADIDELKRRYKYESEIRTREGKAPHPYPHRLEQAMSTSFPPCAGIAVGLERLFLCINN